MHHLPHDPTVTIANTQDEEKILILSSVLFHIKLTVVTEIFPVINMMH